MRLVDGTHVFVAGEQDASGDPIQGVLEAGGHALQADVRGMLAVRFAQDGTLDALVAGGLRQFDGGGVSLQLDPPADIAWWHDKHGRARGAIQDFEGELPGALRELADDWARLASPPPVDPGAHSGASVP